MIAAGLYGKHYIIIKWCINGFIQFTVRVWLHIWLAHGVVDTSTIHDLGTEQKEKKFGDLRLRRK